MWITSLFLAIVLLPQVASAGVLLNEVLFDPHPTNDTGLEWIELYNSGSSPENISGWELYPDGVGYVLFPQGTTIAGNWFLVVHLKTSGTNSATDFYFPQASGNMGDTSGSAALFSGEPRGKSTIKSFVQWGKAGETWESAAADAGMWTKGTFVANLAEGSSIGLINDGIAAGGTSAWKIFDAPTSGALNNPSSSSAPANNTATSSDGSTASSTQASNASTAPFIIPQIHAFAGEDKTTIVGSPVEFMGNASGIRNDPLPGARFWWNFGDGSTAEGRVVSHFYQAPGTYTVGLHVSSGEYAVSDYLTARVDPNQISIQNVIPGEEGFIRLRNPAGVALDIGGWTVETGGKKFILPPLTTIGQRADIALANNLTGFFDQEMTSLTLRYANMRVATEWKKAVERQTTTVSSPPPQKEEHALSKSIAEDTTRHDPVPSPAPQTAAAVQSPARSSYALFLIGALGLSIVTAATFLLFKAF